MSSTAPAPSSNTANITTARLVTGGVLAAAAAAAATTTIAAAGRSAGISLAVGGGPTPLLGFAVLTGVFSLIGLALGIVLARAAHRPRLFFVRTTIALTALSLAPCLLTDAAAATKLLLMLTHLIAAAIVIPTIARRLPQ